MLRKSLFKAFTTGLAVMAASWSVSAAAQSSTCGVTGYATGANGYYDPFGSNSTQTAKVTLSITRIDPTTQAGAKTAIVNFFLTSSNPALVGTQIIPTSVSVEGSATFVPGANIFYASGGPILGPPTGATNPTAGNAFLKIEFTGNNAASNPAIVNFDVILPSNLNVTTSTTFPFDAKLRCTTTGGGPQTDQGVYTLPNAVTFGITVLSAVRASYVGTALDFGEIGQITNDQAPTKTTDTSGTTNYLRVQSSAVYKVTLSSQNTYRLRHPSPTGGAPGTLAENVRYKLHFLGVDRDFANPSLIDVNCARAGVLLGDADVLPLVATLQEGGQNKVPSTVPGYKDFLTVVITPQADTVTSSTNCPAL